MSYKIDNYGFNKSIAYGTPVKKNPRTVVKMGKAPMVNPKNMAYAQNISREGK